MLSCIVVWFALGAWSRAARAQTPFRTSLTATVSLLPSGETHEGGSGSGVRQLLPHAAKEDARRMEALGCRQVTLHWAAHPEAKRYVVYVSPNGRDAWTALPARNACGGSRAAGPTSVIDVEPTRGGATVIHRLYYKVAAYAQKSASAHAITTTTVLPVRLP